MIGEHVIVWTLHEIIIWISWFAHDGYESKHITDSALHLHGGMHIKIVYHIGGWPTHSMRLTMGTDKPPENHWGQCFVAWLVELTWIEPWSKMLVEHNWGDAYTDINGDDCVRKLSVNAPWLYIMKDSTLGVMPTRSWPRACCRGPTWDCEVTSHCQMSRRSRNCKTGISCFRGKTDGLNVASETVYIVESEDENEIQILHFADFKDYLSSFFSLLHRWLNDSGTVYIVTARTIRESKLLSPKEVTEPWKDKLRLLRLRTNT